MKLTSKKNGKGYETSCTISFGSREAKELHLFDEKRKTKKD